MGARSGRRKPGLLVLLTAITLIESAAAQAGETRSYAIATGSLEQVLARFGRESGILLSFKPELTAKRLSPGLQGRYTVDDGLDVLLRGSEIQVQRQANGSYLLLRAAAGDAPVMLSPVSVVPGSSTLMPDAYAGGQVARGGGLGVLGTADMMDTPFSTFNYTASMLDNQQARTLADIVPNEAAVRVLTGSGGFGEDFQIRGLAVPSGDVGLNGLYGLTSASRMPAIMMERVEVIKGAGTLMNGIGPNGSIGGNINIITKRAGDTPLTRLTTVYQSKSQLGQQADISRRFGSDQAWGLRFNGAYRDGETGINNSRQQQSIGVLSLDYAGARLRWSLDAYTQHENADNIRPQLGFTSDVTTLPSPPSSHANFFPGTRLHLEDSVVATRLDYDLSDTLTAYGAFGYRDGRADQILPSGPVGPDGTLIVRNGYYDSYSRTRSGEVGLRAYLSVLGTRHTITLGATRLDQETGSASGQSAEAWPSSIYAAAPLPPLNGTRATPGKTSDTVLTSWYLTDTMALARDRALLTLGLRRQRIELDNYARDSGASTSRFGASAVSPLAGLVLKPWENVSLYANFASGVTRGGTAPASAANAGQIFAPYKSRQYEAGVKVDWGEMTTVASVYQVKVPNAVTDPDSNLYSFDGEQRNRGLELSAYGELIRGLRFMASAAFYDVQLTRTARGLNDGNRANGVPSHSYNLGLDWDVPGVQGLSLMARLTYTSSMYFNAASTISLPGWTRYDAGARYQTRVLGRPVILRANVENLFDNNAWLVSGNYATVSSPRTLLLSAQIDF